MKNQQQNLNNQINLKNQQQNFNNQYNSLTPLSKDSLDWYYTGFCHSDGSLFFTIEKKANSSWGYRVSPMFAITLGIESLELLKNIARFFGCGNIIISKENVTFRVTNFSIFGILLFHIF